MQTSPLLESLIKSLCCLPGVGPKSAQRMAYHLLQKSRSNGIQLSQVLMEALTNIKHCVDCRTLTEHEQCSICSNFKRQQNAQLCIVEMPADIAAIEQTGQYFGRYFVLMGRLSPLDGIGPLEIGLDILQNRLESEHFQEIILATNPSVESDATANYILEICAEYNLPVSRIAHGIPIGGELDTVDGTTLSHSFIGRRMLNL